MVRVVVIAEYPLQAEAVATLIREARPLELTRVIGSRAALREAEAREALATAQVILYVPSGPIEAAPWRDLAPKAGQVLVVADFGGHVGLERALRLGARGYFGPHEDPELLARRVLEAAHGRLAVPPGTRTAAQAMVRLLARDDRRLQCLDDGQKELLPAVASGLTAKEIAARMGLPASRVRRRIRGAWQALGLRSEQELAAWAAMMGFYPLDEEETS